MNTRLSRVLASTVFCLSIGLPARAQVPDASRSYFFPQAGPVATPTEGEAAARFFRACPNNDGGASLPFSARIKVVLRDASDAPIVGLSRLSIYVSFNGGTDVQGFSGDGADSIIANGVFNTNPACPLVQRLHADANTDIFGETYITFAGATSAAPGVSVRDPDRKWGHYDSDLPVFANGVELQGRLTDAGSNGEYVLRIKNFDLRGGLAKGNNQGEVVSSLDYNAIRGHLDDPPSDGFNYWRDLDGDGFVDVADFNILSAHMEHDCGTPNDP